MTEIVKTEPAQTALAQYDFGEDAGAGFENQGSDDFQIPFLALLQSGSPQCKRGNPKYVEGAEPGDLFNTLTNQVVHGAVQFVPCYTEHLFTEWRPRSQGGGFVGRHEVTSPVVEAARRASTTFGKYSNKETGNDLVETFYVYGVVVTEDGTQQPALLAFTSTKIKAYKRWSTQVRTVTVPGPNGTKVRPPLWSFLTTISSEDVSNAKGDFKNFVLGFAGGEPRKSILQPDDPRYQVAKGVYLLIKQGKAQAAYDSQSDAQEPVEESAF